jgi:hypothetical protein
VILTGVIDLPRAVDRHPDQQLRPCNGRFPTLIMLATVFVAAAFHLHLPLRAGSGWPWC